MAMQPNRTNNWRRSGTNALAAALAGLAASIPMGLVMIGLHRYLPGRHMLNSDRRKALPPQQITRKMAQRVGKGELTTPGRAWDPATWLAHLGYGALIASLFPLATRPLPMPGLLRGMLFGLAVWAGSYQGWLPAARILPPATETPARRNAVMILSHIVWGSLIGLLTGRQARRVQEDFTI